MDERIFSSSPRTNIVLQDNRYSNCGIPGSPKVMFSPDSQSKVAECRLPQHSFSSPQLIWRDKADVDRALYDQQNIIDQRELQQQRFCGGQQPPMSFHPGRSLSPAKGQHVAPETPLATYDVDCPVDWSHHYLLIASLQKATTGFLSPSGNPLTSPGVHSADATTAGWIDQDSFIMAESCVRKPESDRNQEKADKLFPERADKLFPERADKLFPERADKLFPEKPDMLFPEKADTLFSEKADNGVVRNLSAIDRHEYSNVPWLKTHSAYHFSESSTEAASPVKSVENIHHSCGDYVGFTGAVQNTKQHHHYFKNEGRLLDTVMHAKSVIEQILRDFSIPESVQVLRTALSLLGRNGDDCPEAVLPTPNGALPSVKLVHPDEFKNASTFLKIYGDPLCFTRSGPLPKKGRSGNWECSKCSNVNFPRRFRCNKCNSNRSEEGDQVVSEYARQVYERYFVIYKTQQQADNSEIADEPVISTSPFSISKTTGPRRKPQRQKVAMPKPSTSGLLGSRHTDQFY